jgi:hypothetical protein
MSTIADILRAFRERIDAELGRAIADGYTGRIWAWLSMENYQVQIHVTRIEPPWPLDGVDCVEMYDCELPARPLLRREP